MAGISRPRKPDFSGAFLKLHTAKLHIASFKETADEYFRGGPDDAWPHFDLKSQSKGYLVGVRRPFPVGLAAIAGDAVHNLRSALDHLIAACARANGGDEKKTHFPIRKTKAEIETAIIKDVIKPGAGEIAAQLVGKAKPYKSANRAIYALHHLDLADKHRLLVGIKKTLQVDISLDGGRETIRGTFNTARNQSGFIPVPSRLDDKLLPAEVGFSDD